MSFQQALYLLHQAKEKKLSEEGKAQQAIELAGLIIEEADRIQTNQEKKKQALIAGMMNDPIGKVFTIALTDQSFRSHRSGRVADQLIHLITEMGIPHFLPEAQRMALKLFALIGKVFSFLFVPMTIRLVRRQMKEVIIPGEPQPLLEHLKRRRQEGVRVNLNHLGEAILGEEEAQRRLQIYLDDLAKPEIEYISIKISTIFSQINLLAWDDTLKILAERLRTLYRAAKQHRYRRRDGSQVQKFVNLDMEEYRDLHLTVALFNTVLSEPEFLDLEAGIVLQSYLPDSFDIQKELTEWALKRVKEGGAPIKIRLVKGANLAMEQFDAELHGWPQAPYLNKREVDANFKRMVVYGVEKKHAQAVHLGIASHNVFDIAYALVLRAENEVEREVSFEMLEGMSDPTRRVVQQLAGEMLLYCPAASQEEFQNAVAYLIRRLDENTAPENYLRHAFHLKLGTPAWQTQTQLFLESCLDVENVSTVPRRTQNRTQETLYQAQTHFQNEADTDWSLPHHRQWAEELLKEWKDKTHAQIPLVIDGETIFSASQKMAYDPSCPEKIFYPYSLADEKEIDRALNCATREAESWSQTNLSKRLAFIEKLADELCRHRKDLIGVMVADTGKTVYEADVEVSEAIDFANYYRLNVEQWHQLPDIQWKAKGTMLIAPPWNFPCSIPAGGLIAALLTGNCVIFKPPAESVLVGWTLAQLFWNAGFSQKVLQFVTCEDDPIGSRLIRDVRLSAVVLTGATATAKLFMQLRPGLDLMAETGGKNTMVISGMSDRDLAIKDLLQSAFGHAGQKCSACSLAILEAEVYDDAHFLNQLRDAAASLKVGSAWNLGTKVNPLIGKPSTKLLSGLTQLEAGESWLLQPKQDLSNLWSPGIKLGVTPASFTFQTELFGPVLGLVRANDMKEAFSLMNQTPYGLTAGLHSLDDREQQAWLNTIEAGNCYINRTVTGAIVQRQPFGGCKESGFGKGAKAGGPNYLVQFMHAEQIALPNDPFTPLNPLFQAVEQKLSPHEREVWKASVNSYAYHYDTYFSKQHDPSQIPGQTNILKYTSHSKVIFRFQKHDSLLDLYRLMAAAIIVHTPLEISLEFPIPDLPFNCKETVESHAEFATRIVQNKGQRVRMLRQPPLLVLNALAEAAAHLSIAPVLANGRLELLYFLREVCVSHDYHRYGNLYQNEIKSI